MALGVYHGSEHRLAIRNTFISIFFTAKATVSVDSLIFLNGFSHISQIMTQGNKQSKLKKITVSIFLLRMNNYS